MHVSTPMKIDQVGSIIDEEFRRKIQSLESQMIPVLMPLNFFFPLTLGRT
jgi:hypothetical protein